MARLPEGVSRSPEETLAEAQRLLDAGMPFHAHEVLEDAWKASEGEERALWRALAQLAVGLTHVLRGNPAGATALLRRAVEGLAPHRERAPYGIDAAGLIAWARRLLREPPGVAAGAGAEPTGGAPAAPRLRRAGPEVSGAPPSS